MKLIEFIKQFNDKVLSFDFGMLLFRITIATQLIVVHGLKKIGIGVEIAEKVPNPLHLPEIFNYSFAVAANLVFPLFVILGWCTRWATLPTLAVILSGYFIVHWNDPLLVSDVPFMYSLGFLFIFCSGPGLYSMDRYFKINSK
ncbi:DoxX family protein [Flavobacterium sp. 5]|uniref:DoxX family protein n=1 Tax=Flavobacterium sp. 5 TaxID=2035199 RepID=UPI000C2BE1F8|nr:DoxX family protein [Flavobacterium sp. 5]PKB18799.1 putative oxidoreductase [Flavobacterium sp. 5]